MSDKPLLSILGTHELFNTFDRAQNEELATIKVGKNTS